MTTFDSAAGPVSVSHLKTAPLRISQTVVAIFSIGMVGLGILALVYRDFAMVWQPVPDWVPARAALACLSGVLMLLCGIGVLFKRTAAWSVRILFPYLLLWTLLKVPAVFVAPLVEGVWLGLGELVVLFTGGWVLFAKFAELPESSRLRFLTGDRALRVARILFAIALPPIGLSHLVYLHATVDFVPAWLPFRSGWAILTGVGQIACGLGVLFSVWPKLAAICEAGMITLFTWLVWAPKIVAAPNTRLPWTAFFISWAIGSAAWIMAEEIPWKNRA